VRAQPIEVRVQAHPQMLSGAGAAPASRSRP
jgi:hypothetical protein